MTGLFVSTNRRGTLGTRHLPCLERAVHETEALILTGRWQERSRRFRKNSNWHHRCG